MISVFDSIIIIIFLIATLFIGLRLKDRQGTAADFILGGRTLTLPAFVATTVSTWYGGILGVGEYSWTYGISNWFVFGVPYYAGAILFALLLSRRARLGKSLTLPQRFEHQYGTKTAKCAGILIFLTTVPGAYVLIMATLCALSFGISLAAGTIMTAVFVTVYLWRGGFNAVVKTDALQMVLMFGSFLLLTLYLLFGYGLEPLESLPASHLEPTGGQSVGAILVWYVIALSTLAEPNFFQRCFAAKTPEIARSGMLISVVCWLLFDLMTTTCGLYARALLPDLANPVEAFPALAAHVLPIGLTGLFFAGLFATVLSTLDSNIFTTAATIGRDLWPEKSQQRISVTARTRIGIVIAAVIAAVIAIAAGSVVKIWKMFGSVSAAALLIPILATYFPRRIRLSGTGALVLMILSAAVTITWFAVEFITGSDWLGLDPLFAGAITAVTVFAVDNLYRLRSKSDSDHEIPDSENESDARAKIERGI